MLTSFTHLQFALCTPFSCDLGCGGGTDRSEELDDSGPPRVGAEVLEVTQFAATP